MLTKKYFSIAEVSVITCLPTHKLRYIEKSDPKIEIIQIRGRRYYTKENIDYIKRIYSENLSGNIQNVARKTIPQIISKIDQLLVKFLKLAK